MVDPTAQHKASAPESVRCSIITVSDTRTEETDVGGDLVRELVQSAVFLVVDRIIVPDEPAEMRAVIEGFCQSAQAILMTGGTGLTARDQTFETVTEMFDKSLPGYGELFRWLSYQDIGPAAMLSRATGGVIGTTVLLTMPGSPKAVRLAMEKLILPELPHLVQQATK